MAMTSSFAKNLASHGAPCRSNALCELIKTTLKDNISHDKVLIHTDTELLFSEDIETHLQQHSIGFGNKPFRFSNRGWKWCSKAKADPRIDRLIFGNVRWRSCLFEGWACLWELHAVGLIQIFRRDVQLLL